MSNITSDTNSGMRTPEYIEQYVEFTDAQGGHEPLVSSYSIPDDADLLAGAITTVDPAYVVSGGVDVTNAAYVLSGAVEEYLNSVGIPRAFRETTSGGRAFTVDEIASGGSDLHTTATFASFRWSPNTFVSSSAGWQRYEPSIQSATAYNVVYDTVSLRPFPEQEYVVSEGGMGVGWSLGVNGQTMTSGGMEHVMSALTSAGCQATYNAVHDSSDHMTEVVHRQSEEINGFWRSIPVVYANGSANMVEFPPSCTGNDLHNVREYCSGGILHVKDKNEVWNLLYYLENTNIHPYHVNGLGDIRLALHNDTYTYVEQEIPGTKDIAVGVFDRYGRYDEDEFMNLNRDEADYKDMVERISQLRKDE